MLILLFLSASQPLFYQQPIRKTRGKPVDPLCWPELLASFADHPMLLNAPSPLSIACRLTKLSTSSALRAKGSCTRLSSLVSLACSSRFVVIHSSNRTLRLIRRLEYLIVNHEIRDCPRQKISRSPV
jgi:hypothetical protein